MSKDEPRAGPTPEEQAALDALSAEGPDYDGVPDSIRADPEAFGLPSNAERDAQAVARILARRATDSGRRTLFDDVLERLGFTREQLDALPDPAVEVDR